MCEISNFGTGLHSGGNHLNHINQLIYMSNVKKPQCAQSVKKTILLVYTNHSIPHCHPYQRILM